MRTACIHCGAEHLLKDGQFGGHSKVQFKCTKCGKTTIVKPRVTLGRKGADIPLNDPEISRHHCLLEVRDTIINLKDLDSTNGTFFDEERVRAAMLRDGTEFRIGGSLIRVNFQRK